MLILNSKSLGIYRILLSIVSAKVIFTLLIFREFLIGTKSFNPNELFAGNLTTGWPFSIFLLSQNPYFQVLILSLGIFSCITLCLGKHIKLSLFCIWTIINSFIVFNPVVPSGSDVLLSILLLISFFLPIDKFYSYKNLNQNFNLSNFATCLFVSQIALVYLSTSFYKYELAWHENHLAISYALNLEAYSSDLGSKLLEFPSLLKTLTKITWHLEFLGGFLLLIPYKQNYIRLILCPLFIFFHLGILIFMNVGDFPLVSIATWIALLPNDFWQIINKKDTTIHKKNSETLLTKIFLSLCFLAILSSNLFFIYGNIFDPSNNPINRFKNPILAVFSHVLRLEQQWTMFGPAPYKENIWFSLVEEKSYTNLLTNKKVSNQKPTNIRKLFQNQYHKKFFFQCLGKNKKKWRAKLVEFYCKKNKLKKENKISLNVYYEEFSRKEKIKKKVLLKKGCG